MALFARTDLLAGRTKIRMQLKDDTSLQRDNFDRILADFLRAARRREDLYCRLISLQKKDSENFQGLSGQLTTEINALNDLNKQLKGAGDFHMPIVEKKTYLKDLLRITYHFCTKLVEILENLRERLRGEQELSSFVDQDKQQILRCYKKQLDSAEFDISELAERMVNCFRGNNEKERKTIHNQSTSSKFSTSTQIISNKQRQHLLKFMKAKQKQQQRKAKLQQQNKQSIKQLRKKGRRLYKIIECQDVVHNYCLTLSKQDNAQAMFVSIMQRNSIAQQQRRTYQQQYRTETMRKSNLTNFRIKRKHTVPQRPRPIEVQS